MPAGAHQLRFPEDLADRDVCRLITVGRRTARRHDVEMWFGVIASTVYFVAGGGTRTDWLRNLLVNPRVEVRIARQQRLGIARLVVDPGERRAVGKAMLEKYGHWGGDPEIGLTDHQWAYSVPAVAVEGWTE